MRKSLLLLFTLCTCVSLLPIYAQLPPKPTSGEIHAAIQKAQVLGSALYMAAHPDDENTRMIAHFANVEKVETAYLSLTRGDGGQNLIASDIRELLGLTRTQELLAARRIDGGTQFFSRANDFGYSKHPDETFNIWDREQVLADAVWVIRKWRPDVIVLRFDPRKPGTTHGHHTASAIIGMEAFEKAGDPNAFPEQLAYVEPWQPKRIYWNAYTWRRDLADHIVWDNVIKVNVGTYLPVLGEGVAEIAARSRSQHKSQGFGSSGQRGEILEDLELLAGDGIGEEGNPFAGIDLSWARIPGGKSIGEALAKIERDFDLTTPSASVPALLSVYEQIEQLSDPAAKYWRDKKLAELKDIIAASLGLYLSASTDEATVSPGDSLTITLEAINRSNLPVRLQYCSADVSVREYIPKPLSIDENLSPKKAFKKEFQVKLSEEASNSGPYWLQKLGSL
ncbi:MAG: PIG-L family deacetylase, partial [Bacteroidota bacterium]